MSGVIIKDSDYSEIESKLNQVKKKVWDNAQGCEKNILHEKDVSFANFRLTLCSNDEAKKTRLCKKCQK